MFLKEDVIPIYADQLLHTLAPAHPPRARPDDVRRRSRSARRSTLFGRDISLVDRGREHRHPLRLRADLGRRLRPRPRGLVLEQQVLAPRRPPLLGADHQLRALDGHRGDLGLPRRRLAPASRRSSSTRHGTFLGILPLWNCFPQAARLRRSSSSPRSPRRTASRSTSPRPRPSSSRATTRSTRPSGSACSSWPSTRT